MEVLRHLSCTEGFLFCFPYCILLTNTDISFTSPPQSIQSTRPGGKAVSTIRWINPPSEVSLFYPCEVYPKGLTPFYVYSHFTNEKPSISQGEWGPKWLVLQPETSQFPVNSLWLGWCHFYCSCSFNWELTSWNMSGRKRADENSVNTAFHLKASSNTYNCFLLLNFQHW